jgi:hypothetical protein
MLSCLGNAQNIIFASSNGKKISVQKISVQKIMGWAMLLYWLLGLGKL